MSTVHATTARLMYGEQARFFQDEIRQDLKHKKKGMVAMASASEPRDPMLMHLQGGRNARKQNNTTACILNIMGTKETFCLHVECGLAAC